MEFDVGASGWDEDIENMDEEIVNEANMQGPQRNTPRNPRKCED